MSNHQCSSYQYNGEHKSVTIEGICFNQGETVSLCAMDEEILLNSGFGRAMLDSCELTKVGEPSKSGTTPKAKAKPDKSETAKTS